MAQGNECIAGEDRSVIEECYINLEALSATLRVKEKGDWIEYHVFLAPDRSSATVLRKGIDAEGEDLFAIQKTVTKSDYPHELVWSPIILWLARGLWGIPLEFKGE